MAPVAGAIIVPLIAQVGIPLAVQLIERWSKEDPTNPQLSDWLAFLKHPVLTKTYDEQMRGPIPTWVAPTTTPAATDSGRFEHRANA